jgi:hypothetical protein
VASPADNKQVKEIKVQLLYMMHQYEAGSNTHVIIFETCPKKNVDYALQTNQPLSGWIMLIMPHSMGQVQ